MDAVNNEVDWKGAYFDLISSVSYADHRGDVGDTIFSNLKKHLGIDYGDYVEEVDGVYLEEWEFQVAYTLFLRGYTHSDGTPLWDEQTLEELREEQEQ